MKRMTILAAFVALAIATVATAAAPQTGAKQEDFHWSGKVAAGAAVEIKGVNGGIVATGAPAGAVEVTATKKGRKSDPAGVKIERWSSTPAASRSARSTPRTERPTSASPATAGG
jgi:hypothetical protein